MNTQSAHKENSGTAMPVVSDKILFKTLPFTCEKAVISEDDPTIGTISGYVSTFGNVDRGGDKIARKAFDETIADHVKRKRPIRMLWMHDSRELIGGFPAVSAKIDKRGLFLEGKVDLNTQRGKEAFSLAKKGFLSDFSIGFSIKAISFEEQDDKTKIAVLEEIVLYEVSLVGEPMNVEANFTEVKSRSNLQDFPAADMSQEWDEKAAAERLEKFGGDIDLSRAGVLDIVDGVVKMVPKGVFSLAGVLCGSRGAIDLGADDCEHSKFKLAKCYEHLGLENPFLPGGFFRIDDLKAYSERELEKLFKNGVRLESKNSKLVTAAIKNLKRDAEGEDGMRDADADKKAAVTIDKIHKLFDKR